MRHVLRILTAVSAMSGWAIAAGWAQDTTTIAYYDCFDLDAGANVTDPFDPFDPCPDTGDFQFAYNSTRVPHAVIFQNQSQGVEIAYSSEPFVDVTYGDIGSLTFTTALIDAPFDSVAVLKTPSGRYYKVGPLSEDDLAGVTFQWQELLPCSGTLMAFETECFDLDAGIIVTDPFDPFGCPTDGDFQFAYNSTRVPHAVIFQNQSQGVEIAYSSEAFVDVTYGDIGSLTFTTALIDAPFDSVAVLKTPSGRYYKVGPLCEDDFAGVTFEWAELVLACPVLLTGDVNVDLVLTAADIIALVNFVFKSGAAPQPCTAAGDVNCSGSVTASDIIWMVNHVFKGGGAPCDVCTLIPSPWSCP